MNSTIIGHIIRFTLLTLAQVLVFSHLDIGIYLSPYIYFLAILMLPFQMPRQVVMIIAFFSGLVVDGFLNSSGMHAASAVLIAFIRPEVANILTPKSGYGVEESPTIHSQGYGWFLAYSSMLTLVYHLTYFLIEAFSFNNLFITLGRSVVSTALAIVLINILAIIFSPAKARR